MVEPNSKEAMDEETFKELMKKYMTVNDINTRFREKFDKIVSEKLINYKNYPADYKLPKLVAYVILAEIADEFKPVLIKNDCVKVITRIQEYFRLRK